MTFLSRGIASSDRRYPGSVDSLVEYHQNTGCGINGQESYLAECSEIYATYLSDVSSQPWAF